MVDRYLVTDLSNMAVILGQICNKTNISTNLKGLQWNKWHKENIKPEITDVMFPVKSYDYMHTCIEEGIPITTPSCALLMFSKC